MNGSAQWVATRLIEAFASSDLDLMASLLAPDVRWGGDEDADITCHDRQAVLVWYRTLHAQGVTAQVTETLTGPDVVIAHLAVAWPSSVDDLDQPRSEYQIFRLVGGLVADIRGYPDRVEALTAAGLIPNPA